MTPNGLLVHVRGLLFSAADPVYREGAARFFQERVALYGVRSAEVKRITAEAYRVWKTFSRPEQNRFSNALWRGGTLEEGSVAIYLNRRIAPKLGPEDFELFEQWLDRYIGNWAHTDGVSSWLLAACLANDPPLMDRIPPWTHSGNRWKRRAAAVSFLQEAKQGRNTDRILDIAERLLDDSDDMVQKGVGWLLKETYPKQPRATVRFLTERRGRGTRLLLRYAAEKMSAAHRKRVLTRSKRVVARATH